AILADIPHLRAERRREERRVDASAGNEGELAPSQQCPLLAQSRHCLSQCTCPLSGVKRTSAPLTTRQFIHLQKNRNFSDPHHSRTRGAILKCMLENTSMRDPMSNSFINWSSRVAIAGRIGERLRPQGWNKFTLRGDYHLPFGKSEAR